jgi:hypothetical protein
MNGHFRINFVILIDGNVGPGVISIVRAAVDVAVVVVVVVSAVVLLIGEEVTIV